MKVIVTGAQGQLGFEITKQLKKNNIEVLSLSKNELDICNLKLVNRILIDECPNIVINCAAFTNVEQCEIFPQKAFKINTLGPKYLSIVTARIGCKLIHISTDYVFDGRSKSPYSEYYMPNPVNQYGRSKLLGEKFVSIYNPRHFIIRTSWLFGKGNNFVKTILDLSLKEKELSIVGDQIGTPTSTKDLAINILRLMQTEDYGIYHGSCHGKCSWYEFAKKILDIKGINIKLNKIKTKDLKRLALRPRYSVLDNYKLKLLMLDAFRPWQVALEDYLTKGGE